MFIIVDDYSNCDCYKCGEKKALIEFDNSIKEITSILKFTPRQFDIRFSFYKPLEEGVSFKQQKTHKLDFVLSAHEKGVIIQKLKSILNENKEFLKQDKYLKFKKVYCRDCGRVHLKSKSNKVGDNEFLCYYCLRKWYEVCAHCGKIDYKGEFRPVSTGKTVCLDCIDKLYDVCPCCGGFEEKGIYIPVNHPPKFLGDPPQLCCRMCAAGHVDCSVCGYSFNVGKGNATAYKASNKKYICKSCQILNHNFIEDWKFKPTPLFWGAPGERLFNNTLMYGIEFEIIHRDSTENGTKEQFAGRIRDYLGRKFAYCKHDGSVKIDDKPYGFEIVTQPFSHEYYMLNRRRIDAMFDWLVAQGAESNYTTGLHIHMSKAAFGTFHLYKFLRFYYSKLNENFIYFISQRNNRDWFNHYSPFRESDRKTLPGFSKQKANISGERHSAVSLMMPATVEVRIFQMFMNANLFHKNMEFCKATYDFSKSNPFQDMTYHKFILFVKDNERTYPNLYEFIKTNGEKFLPKKGFKI